MITNQPLQLILYMEGILLPWVWQVSYLMTMAGTLSGWYDRCPTSTVWQVSYFNSMTGVLLQQYDRCPTSTVWQVSYFNSMTGVLLQWYDRCPISMSLAGVTLLLRGRVSVVRWWLLVQVVDGCRSKLVMVVGPSWWWLLVQVGDGCWSKWVMVVGPSGWWLWV